MKKLDQSNTMMPSTEIIRGVEVRGYDRLMNDLINHSQDVPSSLILGRFMPLKNQDGEVNLVGLGNSNDSSRAGTFEIPGGKITEGTMAHRGFQLSAPNQQAFAIVTGTLKELKEEMGLSPGGNIMEYVGCEVKPFPRGPYQFKVRGMIIKD